jgi:hypothetical protein
VLHQPPAAQCFITTGFDDGSTVDNNRLKETKGVTFTEMDEMLNEVVGQSLADDECAGLVLSPEEMVIDIVRGSLTEQRIDVVDVFLGFLRYLPPNLGINLDHEIDSVSMVVSNLLEFDA